MLKALSELTIYELFTDLFDRTANPTPTMLRFLFTLITFFGCRLGVKPYSRKKSLYNYGYNSAYNTTTDTNASQASPSPNMGPSTKMEVEDTKSEEYTLLVNLVNAIRMKCNAIMALGVVDLSMMMVLYDSTYQEVECIKMMHDVIASWTRIGKEWMIISIVLNRLFIVIIILFTLLALLGERIFLLML